MVPRDIKILFLFLGLAGLAILPACNGNPPVVGVPKVTAIPTYTYTPCGAPATFGDTTIEASNAVETDQIHANPFAFSGGYVQALSMYSAGTGNFRMAIYSDNGSSAPGNLIVQSASQAVTGTGWNTVSVPTTYLASGTYWIAMINDGSAEIYYNYTGTDTMAYLDQTYGAFPSTIPGATICSCSVLSLYAIYCP